MYLLYLSLLIDFKNLCKMLVFIKKFIIIPTNAYLRSVFVTDRIKKG